ncbi:MAG: GNAT family N-acetyltransferase, partial [Pseudomonadota bacterium]|nr:GNAT family N-acetyltransferase [Pseudomonadota bacterium]
MTASIRRATDADWETIWPFFREIVAAGESYAYPVELGKKAGRKIWLETPLATYVAEVDGSVVGSYYLKPNQFGP